MIKNNLLCAPIKVKGPIGIISREIEIKDGGLFFSLLFGLKLQHEFAYLRWFLVSEEVIRKLEKERYKVATL